MTEYEWKREINIHFATAIRIICMLLSESFVAGVLFYSCKINILVFLITSSRDCDKRSVKITTQNHITIVLIPFDFHHLFDTSASRKRFFFMEDS